MKPRIRQSTLLLLVAAMLLTACASGAPAQPQAVQEAEAASSIRLVRTEGTVTLSDEEGADLPVQPDMRLFSGNALATQEESRAGMSLDETKAVTIGQLTEASVHQKGKALSLTLQSGEMFFRVSEPLAEDESFEISTSAMTLAIRGTAGYVAATGETESVVILATGHAVITAVTGETQEIEANQRVTLILTPTGAVFDVLPVELEQYPTLLLEELGAEPSILETADPNITARIVYAEVLSRYSALLSTDPQELLAMVDGTASGRESIDGLNYYSLAWSRIENRPILYGYYDYNGDGVEELVLAAGDAGWGIEVWDVYTYDGERAVELFGDECPYYRVSLYALADGRFIIHGSGGVSYWTETVYQIAADRSGPELVEEYVHDETGYGDTDYHSASGVLSAAEFDALYTNQRRNPAEGVEFTQLT